MIEDNQMTAVDMFLHFGVSLNSNNGLSVEHGDFEIHTLLLLMEGSIHLMVGGSTL